MAVVIGAHLVEPVQVELPDKGSILGVLEVLGEYLLGQFADVFDDESILLRDPLDHICVFGVLR